MAEQFTPGVDEHGGRMGDAARKLWQNLSGHTYLAIVLDGDVPDGARFRERMIGRLRVVGRQSTVDYWSDYAPAICETDLASLESWQYDYTILFDRTSCGRAMLKKYGHKIDKRRNADHRAWDYIRPVSIS